VIPASSPVIPASSPVIPASSPVIPAHAGIQNFQPTAKALDSHCGLPTNGVSEVGNNNRSVATR
ncbi:MAG: hypothetical protein Q8M09_06565, partial [Pseudomonadota bacterium]|nr:hypothetical protein [Pseudomonadota bacterium]